MPRITKASFARAKNALGIKKVTKKNIGRIAKKASGGGGSRSSKVTKSKSKTKRRTSSLARKKRRRGARKFTLPIAPIAGLAAGLAAPINAAMTGDYINVANHLAYNYLGLSGVGSGGQVWFTPDGLWRGLFPLLMGGLVHKFVGGAPLNVNRMLAAAGVPVIRI